MAYRDLRVFVSELDKKGLLRRIKAEVDVNLEITEITDRVCKNAGPALLFENVRGYDIPVLTNAFGSMERMNMALGVGNLDDIGRDLISLIQPPDTGSFLDKLKILPKLAQLSSFLPKTVKSGSCREVIISNRPSLDVLPVLKCWPLDGGPFITLPLVFTKDPDTGRRNVGMYRMQVYDGQTAGMHWHKHKDGAEHLRKLTSPQRLPVAVAIGAAPDIIYAATAPLPFGIDEIIFAGILRKEPVEMVRCETVDLEVPAHSEIILEGYIDPLEKREEGPFGDHTGYYSLADDYPVFHLTCITRREKPIYPATIVGRPPMEDAFFGKATERIFLPALRMVLPEIKDINMPPEGVFHNCLLVSIRKKYPGHARKVISAIWGMGLMMLTKLVVIVDDYVDVQNLSEVAWRVFNNIDARRDIVIVDGPLDALDHSSPLPLYGSKMGIDATRKGPDEGHCREWPDDVVMTPEIKALVDRKWNLYGF